MTTATASRYEIDIEDVEYLRHGDKPLLLRLYKPRGTGPFPLLVDLHGGAWYKNDRTLDESIDTALAKSGIVVAALDFRQAPEHTYLDTLADVNYGIRWAKARAGEWGSRADKVGVIGFSSGGHLAMLAAMRPNDSRYASIPGKAGVDASVRAAVLCWPVIDPLGRFEYAKNLKAKGESVERAEDWIRAHLRFWKDEAAMAEGNPTRALERGEKVSMPPVLYIQGTADAAHPAENRARFLAAYPKAGGRVEPHLFEDVGEAFLRELPDSPQTRDATQKIIEFVHRELA